jgi:hypothetical protein
MGDVSLEDKAVPFFQEKFLLSNQVNQSAIQTINKLLAGMNNLIRAAVGPGFTGNQ